MNVVDKFYRYLMIVPLSAVREDRMPGGRNGSSIYGLYKVLLM